ncbi:MAG: hypothetical protein IPH88_18315 [Bacteroidales bacterium]|nr:hypothetical protein [Bacteroidales bacterium]
MSSAEAEEKLRKEGYNLLPSSKPRNFFHTALGVIKEPMFILLVGCGSLHGHGDLQEESCSSFWL